MDIFRKMTSVESLFEKPSVCKFYQQVVKILFIDKTLS